MSASSTSRNDALSHADLIGKLRHIIKAIEQQSAAGLYPVLMTSEHGGEGVMPIYDAIRALECAGSETERIVTYHGSGEDLATDVHALLDPTERRRFMAKWKEREDVTKR